MTIHSPYFCTFRLDAINSVSQTGSLPSIMRHHRSAATLRYCSDCAADNSVHTSVYNAVETTRRRNGAFSYFHCQSQEKDKNASDCVRLYIPFAFCIVLAAFVLPLRFFFFSFRVLFQSAI